MKYKCFDCGKRFAKQYEVMLHADFHKGEPIVRALGCVCAQDYDVRSGKCEHCGYVHSQGWGLKNGTN